MKTVSLSVDFNGWQVRQNVGGSQLVAGELGGARLGDELSQDYEFTNKEAMLSWSTSGPANLQINCRIEKGLLGLSVNTFLSFYFRPFRLTEETSLIMRLYTADQTKGGQVRVIARPLSGFREKGADWVAFTVVGGAEDTRKCISALTSDQHLYFMLFKETPEMQRKKSETLGGSMSYCVFAQLVKLPLPPDKVFKEVYDEAYQRIASAKDAPPQDRKYLELARTFAIVITPPNDDNPTPAVWLMNLNEKGEIDFDLEEFVLSYTTTRDAAINYAMNLAKLLKLRVLEIA
jgi:hypothetical protein